MVDAVGAPVCAECTRRGSRTCRIATFGQNKPRCTGLVKNKKVTFLSYFLKFGIEFCGEGDGGDGIMGKGRCLGGSKGMVE